MTIRFILTIETGNVWVFAVFQCIRKSVLVLLVQHVHSVPLL